MLLDLVVQIHHMQDVQQLALVLMETLYLHVEDGARIYGDSVVLQDVFRQTHLVLVLDIHELLLGLLVVRVNLQLRDLGQVGDPLVADVGRYPVSQQRVSVKQETALGDAVGLVVELLRHHLIEVLQLLVLQDLGVESRHAVYGVAGHDGQMGHLHLSVIDDGHLADLLLVARILLLDLNHEAAVDLLDNLINTGKQAGEQLDGPFLQGLRHDRMVRVSTGLRGDLPRLIPLQAFLIHQDAHQLGYRHSRMRIVQLEGGLLVELADIVMVSLIAGDGFLHAGGDEEILLL